MFPHSKLCVCVRERERERENSAHECHILTSHLYRCCGRGGENTLVDVLSARVLLAHVAFSGVDGDLLTNSNASFRLPSGSMLFCKRVHGRCSDGAHVVG